MLSDVTVTARTIDVTFAFYDSLFRCFCNFLQTTSIGLHFAAHNIRLSSLTFFIVGSATLFYFYKSDVSAVQGHPRSLNLAPIESAYATSY